MTFFLIYLKLHIVKPIVLSLFKKIKIKIKFLI